MKRPLIAISLAICLAAPVHAVVPLAGIVIGYVKEALKEKLIAYAKQKAREAVRDSLSDVPGAGLLALVPGMDGFVPRPQMPPEALATLEASGFRDANAAPLSDAEWAEYEQAVTAMARAAGPDDEVPDVKQMR